MLNIIKDYLVSVGFAVDNKSFDELGKKFEAVEKLYNKFTKSIMDSKPFQAAVDNLAKFATGALDKIGRFIFSVKGLIITATAAVTTALVALFAIINTAAYKFMNQMQKIDMDVQIFARRMFTTVENARSLKAVMDAMGVSDIEGLKDVAANPELRAQFLELRKFTSSLSVDDQAQQGFKNVRALNLEFQKLGITMNYFFQQLGGYLGYALAGPMEQLREFLSWVNETLARVMPRIAYDFAQVFAIFDKLAQVVVNLISIATGLDLNGAVSILEFLANILEVIVDLINDVLDGIIKVQKWIMDGQQKAHNMGIGGMLGTSLPAGIAAQGLDMAGGKPGGVNVVQRIYDFLTQTWNWLQPLLRPLRDLMEWSAAKLTGPAKFAGDVMNAVMGGTAEASTSGSSPTAAGGNVGSFRWSTKNKSSQAIDAFLNDVAPRLTHAYAVTAANATRGHSPGSKHYSGMAVDIGAAGQSVSSLGELVAAALKSNSLKVANLELLPAKYAAVLKDLEKRGVDPKDPRIKNDTRYMHGEHIHFGVKQRPVVNIKINGGDLAQVRKTVSEAVAQASQFSMMDRGGIFA